MSLTRPPYSETAPVHDRTEPAVFRMLAQGVTAWQTRIMTKQSSSSGESGFHDGHAAVHGQPDRELNGSNAAKSARGMYRINSPSHARYADGCTHRKCGWSSCSIGVVVSSMRLRTRNSRSVVRASARVQCRTSWILRTPSACRPCSVSTGPRCTSASQRSCSCSGDISQVYNASEYLLWR
jgi:hypothetical protein